MFQKFINMLNECDDVQDVYHNVDLPSWRDRLNRRDEP